MVLFSIPLESFYWVEREAMTDLHADNVSGQVEQSIQVIVGETLLIGSLYTPPNIVGIVVFIDEDNAGQYNSQNQYILQQLQAAGLVTLRLSIINEGEDHGGQAGEGILFDIDRLADRIVTATDWLVQQPFTELHRIGYYAAKTSAAAALAAAERRQECVFAVVCVDGRIDLARDSFPNLRSYPLFIIGERNPALVELSRHAMQDLRVENELRIFPGVGDLYEDPEAVELVAEATRNWLLHYLPGQEVDR
jgi:putative phosphoribosyl transferase